MHTGHGHAAVGLPTFSLLVWLLLLLLGAGYLAMVAGQHRKGRRRPPARTVPFLLGLGMLGWAFSPGLNAAAHAGVQGHMTQHLTAGMFAPLALTLGWPMTLLLRSLPVRTARRLTGWLRSRPVDLVASPAGVLLLNVGGLYPLYFTGLYRLMLDSAVIHAAVAFHVVAAGFLYTVSLAGVEPVTTRSSFRARLVTLFLGTAGHATLAKMMYAGQWPRGMEATPEQLQAAAQRMYYWGDLAEVLLMGMAFWSWSQIRGRAVRREKTQPAENGAAWVRWAGRKTAAMAGSTVVEN